MTTLAVTPQKAPTATPLGHRILVCLDRSQFSEVCVAYAITIAKTFSSDLTIAHVMQPPDASATTLAHDALSWEISRQEARGYLERFQEDASRQLGRPADVRLEQGHPAERIVDLAREIRADLTVLGSHGSAGSTAWNLGSTAQQVLAVTRSSVLVIHSPSTAPPHVKRILVPLDGTLRTESVLPAAVRIADTEGAELVLVHVVHEPVATSLHTEEDMQLEKKLAGRLLSAAERYLTHLQEQLAREGARVLTAVRQHTNERQCLLETARHEGADLIVLSAHGSTCDSSHPFGSVTTYLMTHSMIPILVLQDLPERDVRRGYGLSVKAEPMALRARYAPEIA